MFKLMISVLVFGKQSIRMFIRFNRLLWCSEELRRELSTQAKQFIDVMRFLLDFLARQVRESNNAKVDFIVDSLEVPIHVEVTWIDRLDDIETLVEV